MAEAAAVAATTDTVVDKLVNSTRRHAGNNPIKGLGGNVIAETLSLLSQTKEVSGKTSDMGRSHRGTRDGVGLAVGPGAKDIGTGSEDINDRAEVGVVGESVVLSGGTDSAGALLGSRRGSRGILAVVTGCDSEEETGINDGLGSLVDGIGGLTAERHVDNDTVGAVLILGVTRNEVHTSDDSRVGARTIIAEDLDSEEAGLLGYTIGGRTDGTSNVSAVALTIAVGTTSKVLEELGATIEVLQLC